MTAAEIIDLVKNVGFPIAVAGFVLWRLEPRLDKLIEAVRDVSDPDKTLVRLRPLFDEQRKEIVADVAHDVRAALTPVLVAITRRDA